MVTLYNPTASQISSAVSSGSLDNKNFGFTVDSSGNKQNTDIKGNNVVTPPTPIPTQNAYSPAPAGQAPNTPPVTTPVVTSQSAQDDYNTKFANYQKMIADLEAHTNAKNQAASDAQAKQSLDDVNNAKLKLDQQGMNIKQSEADAKNHALQMASGGETTSQTTTPTNTTTTTTPTPAPTAVSTANSNIQTANTNNQTAQDAITAQKDKAFTDFQQKVSQIMSGTFPLSATETALINSVQSSLDRQKQSVLGVLSEESARGGQEYTPGQSAGMLINKTMDLDAAAAGTMASLKLGFEKQDYEMINSAYEKQTSYLNDKSLTIQKLHDTVVANEKDLREQAQKIQDNIDSVVKDAAKNGATPDQIASISGAKTLNEAINNAGALLQTATGTLGDYLQYKKDTLAKGLVPKDYTTYKNDQLYNDESIKEQAKVAADNANTSSDKTQQKLEQQYRGVLSKEFSSRTGALGVENGKVNQANHLDALLKQYYDPKTGDYNVPTAQYAELVMGLATLVSPSGSAEADRAALMSKTAAGDLKGAVQYITGVPQDGNTQEIIKNLVDSIDRQAEIATNNRESALQNLRDQAPTDLEQSRIDALNKSTNMVKYQGQDRVSKTNVNNYIKSNPAEAESIAKLYEVPGATDQDIEAYLKAQGKIQ